MIHTLNSLKNKDCISKLSKTFKRYKCLDFVLIVVNSSTLYSIPVTCILSVFCYMIFVIMWSLCSLLAS